MEIDKKRVGQRIRSIRQSKGMTMEEFGSLFGATKGNVSLWEKGSSIPSNERLPLIAKIGDSTVEELLHGCIEEYLYSFFASPDKEEPTPRQLGKFYELYVNKFGHTYQNEEVIHEFLEYAVDNLEIEGEGIKQRKVIAVSSYINIILLTYLTDHYWNSEEDELYNRALKASLDASKFSFELIVRPFKLSEISKENIKVRTREVFDDMNKNYNNQLDFNETLFDSFFEV